MASQIVVKNLLVSYLEAGDKAAGKTVLFLHGWRAQKEIWMGVISQLITTNYKLVALDLPGFGASQTPLSPLKVGHYGEIVAEFIKKLDLKNIIIVGHSFGGRVGIKLASTKPELISKLVLVDSAGFAMEPNKKVLINTAAKIAKPFFKPRFMQGLRKKIYRGLGAEDYLATPELQQTFVNIVSEDLSADMAKIKCPTLIVTGADDNDTPTEFGDLMKSIIPNSQFIILPQAGHFSFLDQPEKFVNELNKFI